MKIYTKRLIIEPLILSDKGDYFLNISHDKEVLKTFICNYEESLENFNFEKFVNRNDILGIRLKTTNKIIGILTKFSENSNKNSIEIGYGIGSKYWNNGYVTEAVDSFIKFLFSSTKINTIFASHFIGNDASKKVMIKCGMTYSHTNEKELNYQGIDRDLAYYKIQKK